MILGINCHTVFADYDWLKLQFAVNCSARNFNQDGARFIAPNASAETTEVTSEIAQNGVGELRCRVVACGKGLALGRARCHGALTSVLSLFEQVRIHSCRMHGIVLPS